MEKIKKCVIPAAGLGTRFYPLTRAQPKEMLPILDKPVIHYVVEEAVKSGLDEILIIVGAGKESIINYFDKNKLDDKFDDYGIKDIPEIYFVRQKEQKGLADAVRYAKGFVDEEPFVVLLGDTIFKSESGTATSSLMSIFYKYKKQCLQVERVPKSKVQDYGIVEVEPFNECFIIKNIIEKPSPENAPSDLGATGSYILLPQIFDYIKNIKPGKNNELQLADAFTEVIKNEGMIASMLKGKRYDVGTKELWVSTFIEFARNDNRFKGMF
ncbi:UTP--glucose-1-phosphate uridylyltransferase [Caldiplasma sukawensis]